MFCLFVFPRGIRLHHFNYMCDKGDGLDQLLNCVVMCVATPLWVKCEDETHTPKSGKLESSETPKSSEFDCKGQNTSHWGVLYVIGKVLKCRCPKWPYVA
jgi:hypothetical protein